MLIMCSNKQNIVQISTQKRSFLSINHIKTTQPPWHRKPIWLRCFFWPFYCVSTCSI